MLPTEIQKMIDYVANEHVDDVRARELIVGAAETAGEYDEVENQMLIFVQQLTCFWFVPADFNLSPAGADQLKHAQAAIIGKYRELRAAR